ncbi:GDSL-like lipase/acylhydrolase family protein [Metarhizium robertsii]|uniref:Acetyl esterase n=2 Tax=Metarhizium robertsii TaxID=568076 RepID=E9EPV9_METRA|nr:acetyl esterase [Metarhizium robertsii ARSEF 23]EFZ02162.1 acetyl esterase [Metarhizium robertsii ARSEF 23]EXV05328.1 GDSL-like lipase/acylhydrolase family protein [Metarhizium robertsii]
MATKLLTVLAITSGVISAPAALGKFENLVVFGDSYSDEARFAYIKQNGKLPPAGQMLPEADSPFSNGRIWGRLVAKDTGATLYDYAVGGAMCTHTNFDQRTFNETTNIPYPAVLEYELPLFDTDKKLGLYKNLNPDNTVYTLWIGTNDLGKDGIIGTKAGMHHNVDASSTVDSYLTCVWAALDKMYSQGARNIVLFKLAPLEKAPLYAIDYPKLKDSLSADVQNVNAKYDQVVAGTKSQRWADATITIFDSYKFFSDVIASPSTFQFTEVSKPYKTCVSENNCQTASGPQSSYLWNDALHLSPAAEQLISQEFQRAVKGTSSYAKKY